MTRLIVFGPLLLGAALAWPFLRSAPLGPGESPDAPTTPPRLVANPLAKPATRPVTEPTADPCTTGCSIGHHELPVIDDDGLREQLALFAATKPGSESLALDTLLFHGAQTQAFLARDGAPHLTTEQRQFLDTQLALTHVNVTFRIVDDAGLVHVTTEPHQVPLGIKRHLKAISPTGIATHELNGTVQRVGLHSLWSRW